MNVQSFYLLPALIKKMGKHKNTLPVGMMINLFLESGTDFQ